ncbi:Uncharacterised protein [Mycobacteroides abscessus subsp. abscessus]|nr:Uncharacterised protein [Mycobacteroides abscessus subsp. abscessus]
MAELMRAKVSDAGSFLPTSGEWESPTRAQVMSITSLVRVRMNDELAC